jgi:hypothetical protein
MNTLRQRFLRCIFLTIFFWVVGSGLAAADSLVWRKQQNRVDADVKAWDLRELLENVAAETGWHIYLDPGAIRPVSAKFKALPSNEALQALLSGLNYLILPQTNGVTELYVFRTTRTQATTLVAPARKPAKPIPNQLVVTLKPGSKTKIDDLARALGAKVIGRMDSQNTYLLQFDDPASADAARTELASNPDVAGIDSNYPVDPPPAADLVNASGPNLKINPVTNSGNCQLVIGLIDTPIQMQSLSPNITPFLETPISVAGPNSIPPTTLTHGTAMINTIYDGLAGTSSSGNSPVKILPVDVYGNNPTTTTFDVANGIVQAVNSGANILNLSLGSTGNSQVLQNVINQASQQGVAMFAAAGNTPVTTPTYPAAYSGVVAVTASGPNGGIASYANRGSFVQVIAPGDNVVPFDGENYLVEGTSTATAIVSGTAAALTANAGDCANQAAALLQKSANPSGPIKP